MDEIIELIKYFLVDWQQTAIANTRYSVVLIALSVFVGGLIVFLMKRNSIATMKGLLLQGEQTLEKSEKKQEELLIDHKKNTEQRVELEQQVEQLNVKSKQQGEEFQSELNVKEQQHKKELQNKLNEFDGLQSTLKGKTKLTEQLQSKLSQYVLDQEKMVEIEKEYNQLSSEFGVVKQQLAQKETELNDQNIQIEQLEKVGTSGKTNIEQESQAESSNSSQRSEGMQDQLAQLENKIIQLEQDKLNAEFKAEHSVELENTIQQQNQQLTQYNEKLSLILKEPQANTQQDSKPEDIKDGFVNKLLNMISVLDNVDVSDKNQNEGFSVNGVETEDVWQNHKRIIDRLLEKLAIDPVVDIADRNIEQSNEDNIGSIENAADELSAELSDQASEPTEIIDNFQDKLKGFYQKISQMVPKN